VTKTENGVRLFRQSDLEEFVKKQKGKLD
jgi:hypothetical protein